MKTFFLTVVYKTNNKLVKLLYDDELTTEILKTGIKKAFVLNSDPILLTNMGIQIEEDCIIDYINQYKSNLQFALYVKEDENIQLAEACETSGDTNVPSSIINLELNQTLGLSDNTLMFNLLNNFDTKAELQQFIGCNLKSIVKSYSDKKTLSNFERIVLSKTIMKHIIDLDPERGYNRDQFEALAQNIVQIFPTETVTTYYKRYCEGKVASGKLWDAFNNYRKKLSQLGIIRRRSRSSTKSPASVCNSPQSSVLDLDNEAIVKADLDTLAIYVEGNQLKKLWKSTFQMRKELLLTEISSSDYIKKFPALEQTKGYELFSVDVELLYDKKPTFNIEDNFFNGILKKAEKSHNKKVSEILELISKETNDICKKVLSLLTLSFLLPTTQIKRGRKSATSKPSKIEVQESFICHYDNLNEADTANRKFIDNYEGSIQPRLILIGSPLNLANLYIAHIKYSFLETNIKEAIEACMGAYLALNITYPNQSKKIWYFLQKYIFQINTPYDYHDTATETLHNDLIRTKLD